jgi:hypothetical protein
MLVFDSYKRALQKDHAHERGSVPGKLTMNRQGIFIIISIDCSEGEYESHCSMVRHHITTKQKHFHHLFWAASCCYHNPALRIGDNRAGVLTSFCFGFMMVSAAWNF